MIRYKPKKRVRVHRGAGADLTALEILAIGTAEAEKPAQAEKVQAAEKPARTRAPRKRAAPPAEDS